MQPTAFETEVEKRLEDESCVLQIVKVFKEIFFLMDLI